MASPGPVAGEVIVDDRIRTRKEVIKEIELVLEAKKNVNTILTTMYSVFFAIEGGLVLAFYLAPSNPGKLGIASFGWLTMLCLLLVTLRARATNTNCDSRAVQLEKSLGMRIISNYVPEDGKPVAGLIRIHNTLAVFDVLVLALWPVLVAIQLGFMV
jgi:hypothetical protein